MLCRSGGTQPSLRLRPDATSILDEAVTVLNRRKDILSVDVVGHTDSTGLEQYNQGLPERRAKSVHDHFVSNATREGRAKNRRVERVVK